MTTKLVVALDWTPNTNHSGFFVAQAQGLYQAQGLDVEFVSPLDDSYAKTPRQRVEAGEAHFGIAPSETVISCHTSDGSRAPGQRIVAVAALLQTQTSAIVTLKASGIESPKQLDGKKYASYEGRFEMPIVQQLIRDAGGEGTAIEVKPGEHGLGIFNTLLSKPEEYHATWVFMPWEGVIAKQRGVGLNVFALEGVPYGYTPILVGREDVLEDMQPAAKAFLAATAEGYKFAAKNPAESAGIVVKVAKHKGIELGDEMVTESARELAPAFLTPGGEWGKMDEEKWALFCQWLRDKGIVTDRSGAPVPVPPPHKLFTNKYL
jgi:ABC-type nitrate/sulfonate/bicarbonate transport system substrate-binding protein